MNELELLVALHKDNPQQGPGSEQMTLRALELTGLDTRHPLRLADIGCGTGASTLALAQNTRWDITAVDLFPEFLGKLEERAAAQGLSQQIQTLQADMASLPFGPGEWDVLWSEGAIYNMGFEAGLEVWRPFLKPSGILVVSEISWITPSRPKEIEQHWQQEYPGMDTISGKIRSLEEKGYSPIAHFVLPPDCWERNYYEPISQHLPTFLEKHGHEPLAAAIAEAEKEEMRLYARYKSYYSYGMYVARKV